jgi:hypothetical protein
MTVQIKDTLIYKDQSHSIRTHILAPYFKKYPEKKPKSKGFFSGLIRGYMCETIIKENKLFVNDISLLHSKRGGQNYKDIVSQVFPDPKDRFLDWFSGIIVLTAEPNPDHPASYRLHPIHEYNELLEIRNGIHTGTQVLTYDELVAFKKEQFILFKKSVTYQQMKAARIAEVAADNKRFIESEETEGTSNFNEAYFEHNVELLILDYLDRFY